MNNSTLEDIKEELFRQEKLDEELYDSLLVIRNKNDFKCIGDSYNEQDIFDNITNDSSKDDIKNYLQNCELETTIKWFINVAVYELSSSKMTQHRKNLYSEIKDYVDNPGKYKQSKPIFNHFVLLKDQLNICSNEYRTCSRISLILHSLFDYLLDVKKKDLYHFIFRNWEHNDKHRIQSFDEIINYYIKKIDNYLLKRCLILYRSLAEEKHPIKHSIFAYKMLHNGMIKYFTED